MNACNWTVFLNRFFKIPQKSSSIFGTVWENVSGEKKNAHFLVVTDFPIRISQPTFRVRYVAVLLKNSRLTVQWSQKRSRRGILNETEIRYQSPNDNVNISAIFRTRDVFKVAPIDSSAISWATRKGLQQSEQLVLLEGRTGQFLMRPRVQDPCETRSVLNLGLHKITREFIT